MNCISILIALTTHLGLENNYNSIHPHIRCTFPNLVYGAYYNSEYNLSFYVGQTINIKSIDVDYGLVSGYSGQDVVPMIRFKKDNIFIAPSYEVTGNYGIVIGYEFKLR